MPSFSNPLNENKRVAVFYSSQESLPAQDWFNLKITAAPHAILAGQVWEGGKSSQREFIGLQDFGAISKVLQLFVGRSLSSDSYNRSNLNLSPWVMRLAIQIQMNPRSQISKCHGNSVVDLNLAFAACLSASWLGSLEGEVGFLEKGFTKADGGLMIGMASLSPHEYLL